MDYFSFSALDEGILLGVTSFKVWLILYGSLLVLLDSLFFTYFPTTLLGTLGVAGLLFKFRLPQAAQRDVQGFFGTQFRPSLRRPSSSTDEGEEEGGQQITIKSQLLLMRSPQGTSTPRLNGHGHTFPSSTADQALTVIGHRGAGLDAPENSLSAIRECKKRGCSAVEFDLSLTKDKVPVLFHDDNLIRIAGVDRDINDMTWEELQRVDISILHPLGEKFRKERVPSFEEAVNLCLSLGMKFIIDLKDDDETVINAVVAAFQKHQVYSMGVVSSFYVRAVYEVRRRDPKIIGCMAWRPGYYRYRGWNSDWQGLERRFSPIYMDWAAIILDCLNTWGVRNVFWWFLGLSAILFHKDSITREESFRWMKRGIRSYVWTVNSPVEKLNFVQNVQLGYLTDTLDGGEVNTLNSLQLSSIMHTTSPNSSPGSKP